MIIGEFLELLKTRGLGYEALALLERLQAKVGPEDWEAYINQALEMELLVNLRACISNQFKWRISTICTEALYDRMHRKHVETIRIYDDLAASQGFIITAKREFISYVEIMRDAGLIQVTNRGVSLTREGEKMADEVQREIDENRD